MSIFSEMSILKHTPLLGAATRAVKSLLLISTLGLLACTTALHQEGPRSAGEVRQLKRNYEIGVARTANVGEAMVKFQDFWSETIEEPVVIPRENIRLVGGPVDLTLAANTRYPVRGKIVKDGIDYTVVSASDPHRRGILLGPDGVVHDRIVVAGPDLGSAVVVIYTMAITPPGAKLLREKSTTVKATKGYENFELLYTGANANGLNLTYREFSPDGLARVAFFQNLTYPIDAKSITFKKYRIAVASATAENITFTVLADGE